MKTAKIRFLLILFAFLLLGAGLGEIKLSKCEPKSGIVTIAFDDGTYNQFTNALDQFERLLDKSLDDNTQ